MYNGQSTFFDLLKVTLYNELAYCARTLEGQKKRYKDQLDNLLKKAGLRANWKEIAEDYTQWLKIVRDYDRSSLSTRRGTGSALRPMEYECDSCGRKISSKISHISHVRSQLRGGQTQVDLDQLEERDLIMSNECGNRLLVVNRTRKSTIFLYPYKQETIGG